MSLEPSCHSLLPGHSFPLTLVFPPSGNFEALLVPSYFHHLLAPSSLHFFIIPNPYTHTSNPPVL